MRTGNGAGSGSGSVPTATVHADGLVEGVSMRRMCCAQGFSNSGEAMRIDYRSFFSACFERCLAGRSTARWYLNPTLDAIRDVNPSGKRTADFSVAMPPNAESLAATPEINSPAFRLCHLVLFALQDDEKLCAAGLGPAVANFDAVRKTMRQCLH
ncbi:hypothetical protein Dda_1099 [Drechslerella dactyloides]|uniref:Uncharacterized protein n=1 Tax=Drechslerella dactyloides TaxID=74499 RepID=A0AAD6J8K1_DREDA|nr:hypothetical protein Dda_1099 [Drechslerella dactyloides]